MVGRMGRLLHPRIRLAAFAALLALVAVGCAGANFGPVPGPASPPGPADLVPYRSGEASVQVTGPASGRFHFKLEPSAIYVSAPSRLDLAYGDPATGEGLTVQVGPEVGTSLTSKFNVLTLDVRLAG